MEALDLFGYLDYREFCRDFYEHQKETDPKFSYRYFARRAKVAPSYLKHIIDGKRNLSPEMSLRFSQGMGLSSRESEYFENLVRFNQAHSIEDKGLYFERLRKKRAKTLKTLGMAEAAGLLSDWYVIAIKELVVNLNTNDAGRIQRVLRKKVPEAQIEDVIQKLESLGWIRFDGEQWSSRAHRVQFPDEVRSYVIQSFHRQMLGIAQEALSDSLDKREFGAAVFAFPENKFQELKEKVKSLQEEIIAYVQDEGSQPSSSDSQKIYFLGVQCFSLQEGETQK